MKINNLSFIGLIFALIFIANALTYSFHINGQNNSSIQAQSTDMQFYECQNPYFIAINSSNEIYSFPISDQPQVGQLVGIGNVAAVADFDNDGFCEVLAIRSSDRILRLYNMDKGDIFEEIEVSDDAYPIEKFKFTKPPITDSAVADFDNNGFLDFAFTGRQCAKDECGAGGEGLIQLQLNMGANHFIRRSINISGVLERTQEGMNGIDAGDFNHDGNQDLAAQQYWSAPVTENITHIMLGNGDGTFTEGQLFSNPIGSNSQGGTLSLVSGDFNNNGILDIIVGQDDDGDAGQTWMYRGNGNGTFFLVGESYDTNPSVENGIDNNGSGLSDAYDFDANGTLDIIAVSNGIGLLLFKGIGNGLFAEAIELDSGNNWYKVMAPPETPNSYNPCTDMSDVDEDGLPYGWEICGYYHERPPIGQPDVDLPAMGADPTIKDIFVEIDWMYPYDKDGNYVGHTHQLSREAINLVVSAFERRGIHLHIDWGGLAELRWGEAVFWFDLSNGEKLPHRNILQTEGTWDWSTFDFIKNTQLHFKPERRGIFHYALAVHALGGGFQFDQSGIARPLVAGANCADNSVYGTDFVISLGEWHNNEGTPVQQAAVFMHELGHNLGLCHGGNEDINYKPNYLSVMNYSFVRSGLVFNQADGYIDYSMFGNETIPPLLESNLNQSVGLNGGQSINNYGTRWYCRDQDDPTDWENKVDAYVNSGIDWNCNLAAIGVVSANINDGSEKNPDPTVSTLFAFNDWDAIHLNVFNNDINNTETSQTVGKTSLIPGVLESPPEELTFEISESFSIDYEIALGSSSSIIVSPGLSTTIPVTLTNTGALTSTVTFTKTTEAWFDLSQIPLTVTLPPNSTLIYDIGLNIPPNTVAGNVQEVILSASLTESPSMSDSVVLEALVGPVAWFDASPAIGKSPHTVVFKDNSVGDVSSWLWDFGDGNTSTLRNPTHTYILPGNYTVSLTVTTSQGSDTFTLLNLIRVQANEIFIPILMK